MTQEPKPAARELRNAAEHFYRQAEKEDDLGSITGFQYAASWCEERAAEIEQESDELQATS